MLLSSLKVQPPILDTHTPPSLCYTFTPRSVQVLCIYFFGSQRGYLSLSHIEVLGIFGASKILFEVNGSVRGACTSHVHTYTFIMQNPTVARV